MHLFADSLLLLLLILIVATLAAFFAGFTPYPYGIIVLSLLVIARLQYLRTVKGPPSS